MQVVHSSLRCLLAASLVMLLAGASALAPKADEIPIRAAHSVHSCAEGKIQRMGNRTFDAPADPTTVAFLEAMDDTDVLHNKLDIEVSNLNPGSNTCDVFASNVMTIQSKSSALTEFTFRLRSQYAILGSLINDTIPIVVTATSTTTRVATLDRTYGMDEVFTLTIIYSGNSVSSGFGSFEVRTQSGVDIVASLSEPYYSYTWWPTKDGDVSQPGDNSDKSTLELSVTVPNNFVVPGNGLLQSVDTLSGNRKRYNWVSNYPIAPYLVAFAATNYNTWTSNYVHSAGTMPVDFFIYPSNDNPTNRANWEKVIDMLAVFAPIFGEYPFINEKYGLYNFPFGGGMEHQTITGQSSFGESLSAHELGHQWWGDDVTCKTWSDIWLNEGFATYSECLWEEHKTGAPSFSAYRACMLGRKPSSVNGSVYIPPAQLSVSRIFSSNFSYRKGAWVLHMLRHLVGDTTFFQTLLDHRAAHEGSAATTDEFAAVASSAYGQDLTWFFDQWVYQSGAPAYQFGWDTSNINGQDYVLVKIEQTHLIPTYPNVFTMPVDLQITIGGNAETVTASNDQRVQWFAFPTAGPVTALSFDPLQWILRTSAAAVSYKAGDLDGDLDVDTDDFTLFEQCFANSSTQLVAGCEPVDFNGSGTVNCDDWLGFSGAWTGPGQQPFFTTCGGSAPALAEFNYPHGVRKNRYVTFVPNPANTGLQHGYQVAHAGTGQTWYISTPRTTPDPSIGLAYLVSDTSAPLHDFATLPFIHVGGCMIAPGEQYEIRATTDGVNFSAPLSVETADIPLDGRWWADVVGNFSPGGTFATVPPTPANSWTPPDSTVNGFDITAVLQVTQGASSAPHITWVDVNPELPDRAVNGNDVLRAVNAFAVGTTREFYPYNVPTVPGLQGQSACPTPPVASSLAP